VWFLIISAVLIGFAGYIMTPEERARALVMLRAAVARFCQMALGGPPGDPFGTALAERNRWPVVSFAVGIASILIFLSLTLGIGSPSGTDGLIAWGANIGPLTTNWGWHRLLTTAVVHPHLLDLLVNLAGLAAFGIIAERLIGSLAFAAVCTASVLTASIVSLWLDPLRISTGASGAVLGVYGLLLATAIRVFIKSRDALIPLEVAKPLAPVAIVFMLYSMVAPGMLMKAEGAAFIVGAVLGIVLTKDIAKRTPRLRLIGRVMAATALMAMACAFTLRGIDDGRLEVAAVTAIEERTARKYEADVDRYNEGGVSAEQLIKMIESTIVPELEAAQQRISLLDRVPDEQKESIDYANQYLQLRQESWRLRIDGLRQRSILEGRQKGRNRPGTANNQKPAQLLEASSTALLKAEAAERTAIKDLRAAAAILN
jgi:membrane associated rhomboid family serine protease